MRHATRIRIGVALATGLLGMVGAAHAQVYTAPGQYYYGPNGTRYNPTTGSTHIPGQAVVKPSGIYHYTGNGYYRNPATGNVYNPYTRTYIRRW